jgi:hypothetical protein
VLLGLKGLGGGLLGGQTSAHGAGQTGSKVKGELGGTLEGLAGVLAELGVVDSEDLSNGLADITATRREGSE